MLSKKNAKGVMMRTDNLSLDNPVIEQVRLSFTESIQTTIHAADAILSMIAEASEEMVRALLDGHKILLVGNGSSSALAMLFGAVMINRFQQERPSLPALVIGTDLPTVSAITEDYHFSDAYAKQIRALGQPGDILLILSTTGHAPNIINAIKAAHDKNISVIALTGQEEGKLPDYLRETDIAISIPTTSAPRIHEAHLLILHCFADVIDMRLFGTGESNPC